VRTFTASFPESPAYDEGPAARAVAAHLRTEHTDLTIEQPHADLLEFLARQYDEPIADSSMIPTWLISRAIRAHATVALGGDGGDELFGGYPHYRWLQRQAGMVGMVPNVALRAMSRVGERLPIGARGRNHLIGTAGTLAQRVAHVNLYFDARSRARMLAPACISARAEHIKEVLCADVLPSRVAARVDFLTYLTDSVLVKTDRASMATSLELRAPFLDVRMIEFAFGSVPERLKVGKSGTKIILRDLARRHLPAGISDRKKQGFSIPMDEWMRGSWGNYTRAVLADVPATLFDRAFIDSLQNAQRKGYNNANRLYALTMFELWRRAYGVEDLVQT
jgi:asparagine synthase (glutamine-hydrolysing)